MATIAQRELFSWKEVEKLGDLERLDLVLKYLPDEGLMQVLESERGNQGRNDYPIRAVWNSILAGVIYGHESIESLRRELWRNTRLLWLCGFELSKEERLVPSAGVYTRFLKKLIKHAHLIEEMFDVLVEELRRELPDLGQLLAADGKAIRSVARSRKDDANQPDGRRDMDADWGVKKYWVDEGKNGNRWLRTKKWFGYKLHLVVDANYELPVAYQVTKASEAEQPQALKMVRELKERHPGIIGSCAHYLGDKGLDDAKLHKLLWDECQIKPVIDIRNCWKDGEVTRAVESLTNVVYDYKGTVFCYDMRLGHRHEMAYGGFEAQRGTLKYRCPARHYGCKCHWKSQCEIKQAVRIPLSEDRRIFTPVARSSYKWKDFYKKRTAVERVNSRIDGSFGFERHFIRGQAKMKARMGMALIVMLSMALGRIKEKQRSYMRSLLKAA